MTEPRNYVTKNCPECSGTGLAHYVLRRFRRNGRVRYIRQAREVDGEYAPHVCRRCLGHGKLYWKAPSGEAGQFLASLMGLMAANRR